MAKVDAARAGGLLQHRELLGRADLGVGQRRQPAHARHRINQNVLPLAVEFRGQDADAGDVAAGSRKRWHQPLPDHVVTERYNRNRFGQFLERACPDTRPDIPNDIGCQFDNLRRQRWPRFVAQAEAARRNCKVLTLDESQQAQLIEERGYHRRVAQLTDHDTEAIDTARPLRARRKRPSRGRAAQECDEVAPLHSITSSARVRRLSEILRPSAVAVFKLITSSNLVG
jgi:hypothetical protein